MRLIALLCTFTMLSFVNHVVAKHDGPLVQLVGLLRGTVHYVHHDKQQLVINDRRYTMPLNFKASDAKGSSIGRFGIKVGQSVEYFVRYDEKSNIYYVDRLKLLN